MFLYGFDKIIPLQMPFPRLRRLVEPYGNFAPMSVLWYSIGAAPHYETFAGCAEALGGLLLILPVTTTLGALVCLADMVQVFMLNMTYDVPVKLFSFHLILMALFLLAPDFRRLRTFFFTQRATNAPQRPPLFRSRRANGIALAAQAVLGLYLIGMNLFGALRDWRAYGPAHPVPSLYGIWEVEQMSVDGADRPPVLTDSVRWRRVIFDGYGDDAVFSDQRMNDAFDNYSASIDDKSHTFTLTIGKDPKANPKFTFDRPSNDRLVLDGALDGHQIHAQLKRFDIHEFALINRGFHWISEYPFQR